MDTEKVAVMDEKKKVRTSKFMSWLLRHGLNERSIKYDEEGFILLSDLTKQPEMKDVTFEDIQYVVSENDKKRFTLKEVDGIYYIRANQGHSKDVGSNIDDDASLTRMTEALPICVHGTNKKAWKVIETAGLSSMGRKHVHLATGLAHDDYVISGMRKSSSVIIFIDMQKAMDRGKRFFISSNGVVLTPDHLEPDLFSKVSFS
ncbi:phosphotransferase KptA/Tpt1 [Yasminevirus sp. GU-2018]|uniref:Phosphotransferase KptA/Tpt1 n=1 Tax=Yasminevirus sp. GU-2018 TaxID=2420051 RepID=A0A5K0U9D2_9VIRU|nr:phosphotransferase KptA/Tpt1 [Yasminevirus sp. GU-2018]